MTAWKHVGVVGRRRLATAWKHVGVAGWRRSMAAWKQHYFVEVAARCPGVVGDRGPRVVGIRYPRVIRKWHPGVFGAGGSRVVVSAVQAVRLVQAS